MFSPDDRAFIRAILANPAELTAWLVYADWLDEHDNPLHAEFLRLMARRGQLRNTDREWYDVEERLIELRAALNHHWVTVFDRPKIENCEFAFRFVCPKKWEQLEVTGDPTVRHCLACEQSVYYCHTLPEAQAHAREGHCVAVQLGVLRYPGDLTPPRREELDGGMTLGVSELIGELAIPEPRRRPWWKFW